MVHVTSHNASLPLLKVDGPLVEPHEFGVKPKRHEEVEGASVPDMGRVLDHGLAQVATAEVGVLKRRP